MNLTGASCMDGKNGVIFCICGGSGPFDHAATVRTAFLTGSGTQRQRKDFDDSRSHSGKGRCPFWETGDSWRICIWELEAFDGCGPSSLSTSRRGRSSYGGPYSASTSLEEGMGTGPSSDLKTVDRQALCAACSSCILGHHSQACRGPIIGEESLAYSLKLRRWTPDTIYTRARHEKASLEASSGNLGPPRATCHQTSMTLTSYDDGLKSTNP